MNDARSTTNRGLGLRAAALLLLLAALQQARAQSGDDVGLTPQQTGDNGACADVKDVPGASVNVAYDGAPGSAVCDSPTCRRFRGSPSSSCATAIEESPGWELLFALGDGRSVEILSCPADEVLTIALVGDTGAFTPEERAFFERSAERVESTTAADLTDLLAVDGQLVRAARILASWPDGLPVNYALDPAGERAGQTNFTIAPGNDTSVPAGGTLSRRSRALETTAACCGLIVDAPLYTSMCPHLGSYLRDPRGSPGEPVYARLDFEPACAVAVVLQLRGGVRSEAISPSDSRSGSKRPRS